MILRFTIGPVQEFVRQSRRTRDLWGSSFLLSFLAGHAMKGAETCGKVILPRLETDPLYAFIQGKTAGEKPRIGSLPNRFDLLTDTPEEAARVAITSFQSAWQNICARVWHSFIEPVAGNGYETKNIFDRQVGSFWEIQWVAAPDESELLGLLEKRKAWRSRVPNEEPGDKCVIMPCYQELSGYHRARERERQDHFWNELKHHNHLRDYELRQQERLCGIALVKRLYAHDKVVNNALGWNPGTKNWPSTLHVAATPWIIDALKTDANRAQTYADHVREIDQETIHEKPHPRMNLAPGQHVFASLDANLFFVDALGNDKTTFTDRAIDPERRKALQKELVRLYGKGEDNSIGPPASFYALVLMDGDRVGNLLADADVGPQGVSRALDGFTKRVQDIVESFYGSTVYAGGDDVLALVPVPGALECAAKLRAAYRAAFDGNPKATTSAGIVLAHIRRPLMQVLDEAHRLLDEVAKAQNGRDSIAISLLRSGDRALQWVTTWEDENGASRLDRVFEMRDKWRKKAERRRSGNEAALVAGEISSGLVYRLREVLGLLCGWPRWEAGVTRTYAGADDDVVKLFAAEIRRMLRASGLEGEDDGVNQKEAEQMARELLSLVYPCERIGEAPNVTIQMDRQRLGLDGLLLALFLSTDGKERDHGAMEASR